MGTTSTITKFRRLVKDNKKVIENYFFMTILQILNSFFYLLIYPYLIRTLGAEGYGLFVFATSVSFYFMFLVNFGFDLPATKAIAENLKNPKAINEILSVIFTSKLYLFIISLLVFGGVVFVVPIIRENLVLFFLCFISIISFVIFPQWYFQAIQNMRIVTSIQLGFKIISLPLIFYFVNEPSDLNIYALIVSCSTIGGGVFAFLILIFRYKVKFTFATYNSISSWFKIGLPFFLSNSAGIVKEQSITIIIGSFFGMRDVAIYDLANKLILIPRTLFLSINSAIFPKLILNITKEKVKKIINVESVISVVVVILVVILGRSIIRLMAGEDMLDAYPMAIFLSFTIITWLVVGAYISFVFIPSNRYFLVTKNQIVALSSFAIYLIIGLSLYKSILVFGAAVALSGLTEIVYCKYVTKKFNLL